MYVALPQEPEHTEVVMEGTFFINDRLTRILFDYGTSHFLIAQDIVSTLGLRSKVL